MLDVMIKCVICGEDPCLDCKSINTCLAKKGQVIHMDCMCHACIKDALDED